MKYFILSLVVIIAIICRLFIVSVYKVSTQSMAPTLLAGDFIFSLKTSYGLENPWSNAIYIETSPNKGELVAFIKNSKIYIKRVMATSSDQIEFANGEYIVNSDRCVNSYKEKFKNSEYALFHEKCGPIEHDIIKSVVNTNITSSDKIKLTDRQIFVVNDHRNFSDDSGPGEVIILDQIVGKPVFIWMSYSSTQDFISETLGIRWNRILTKLN